MRVCSRCGTQNFDIKQKCDKCGYPLYEKNVNASIKQGGVNKYAGSATNQGAVDGNIKLYTKKKASAAAIAAKVFLILTNIAYDLAALTYLVLWIVSLSISSTELSVTCLIYLIVFVACSAVSGWVWFHYSRKLELGETVGIAFKICTLLFINLIAGVLMLCDNGYVEDVNVVVCGQAAPQAPIERKDDKFDEMKKYKDLLEKGIITQEEFESKKKDLLGL